MKWGPGSTMETSLQLCLFAVSVFGAWQAGVAYGRILPPAETPGSDIPAEWVTALREKAAPILTLVPK